METGSIMQLPDYFQCSIDNEELLVVQSLIN